MMAESNDGPYAEVAEARRSLVGPAPVRLRWIRGHHPLPEHGVTKRCDTKVGESIEIVEPVLVTSWTIWSM